MSVKTLVYDTKQVELFCKTVLPELVNDEVIILLLSARKKYGNISRSHEILNRCILRKTDIKYILHKIQRLSYVEDMYYDLKTKEKISLEVMALYIDLSPKSVIKAIKIFNTEIYEWLQYAILSDFDLSILRRIDIKLFSAIHRCNSRRPYILVDIDKKSKEILYNVIQNLEKDIVWITETRGGFHVLVNRNKSTSKKIHTNIKSIDYVEIHNKPMTPIPGTLQGGFKVRRIKIR